MTMINSLSKDFPNVKSFKEEADVVIAKCDDGKTRSFDKEFFKTNYQWS